MKKTLKQRNIKIEKTYIKRRYLYEKIYKWNKNTRIYGGRNGSIYNRRYSQVHNWVYGKVYGRIFYTVYGKIYDRVYNKVQGGVYGGIYNGVKAINLY